MNDQKLAPICLFVYNRLEETKKTVAALQQNHLAQESELFVFSDGWKNEAQKNKILEVREFLKTITGFKKVTVFESETNKGLATSIINGVSLVLEKFGNVIVLEDDLITTPNFLDFMNSSLDFYASSHKIQSIAGYSLAVNQANTKSDVYFHNRAHSWSWATWKKNWNIELFDKDKIRAKINEDLLKSFNDNCGEDISRMLLNSLSGKNDSWYVRWAFDHFLNNKFTVYPYLSKTENIGFSAEGTNCNDIDVFKSTKDTLDKRNFTFIDFEENIKVKNEYLYFFSKKHKLIYRIFLLKTFEGRRKLFSEIKRRFLKK